MSVALVGPDGAGKSTLAARLQESVELPAVSIYMGLYQRERRLHRGVRGLRLVLLLAEQWRRWLDGWLHQMRGDLVIYDRYAVDALLPVHGPATWSRRFRRWLLAHGCPRPHVVVLLDAPGEVLSARKGGEASALEFRRREYLDLRTPLPGMVVLDARRSIDELRRELTKMIWRRYSGLDSR